MHRVCRLQTFAWLLLARRRQDEAVGYVDVLGVDPEHQDRGLGTSLLGSAFAAFVEVGLREAGGLAFLIGGNVSVSAPVQRRARGDEATTGQTRAKEVMIRIVWRLRQLGASRGG